MNVKAKFVFYYYGYDIQPSPSYYIVASDCPTLPAGGNVGPDQLMAAGFPLPITPLFETWRLLIGKKVRCPKRWCALKGATDFDRHVPLCQFKKFKKVA